MNNLNKHERVKHPKRSYNSKSTIDLHVT